MDESIIINTNDPLLNDPLVLPPPVLVLDNPLPSTQPRFSLTVNTQQEIITSESEENVTIG